MDESFDLKALPDAKVAAVPWYFRLGHYLAKRGIPTGRRLLHEARRRGLLDQLAVYPVGHIQLRVPLWRPCNEWDADDVLAYEAPFIASFAAAISRLPPKVTLIDCGADIGTVSAQLVGRCRNITRVIAFEPNPAAFDVLRANLDALPVRAHARYAAVGSDPGRCQLVRDTYDPSAHAMFVVPQEAGPIEIEQIDALELPPDTPIAIKIDVEGSEAAVAAGALMTIRRASAVAVAFEAVPRVTRRTGEDPIQILRALRATRADFTFSIDQAPQLRPSLDVPLFEQLPPDRVYNVVACSRC
jgi:FkbM family methyltransferase